MNVLNVDNVSNKNYNENDTELFILDRIVQVIVFPSITVVLLFLFIQFIFHRHHSLVVLLDCLLVAPPLDAKDDDDDDCNQGDTSSNRRRNDGVQRGTLVIFITIPSKH